LAKNLLPELARIAPIVTTGFKNLQHPTSPASAFCTLLAQQMASRFSQHGYQVIALYGPGLTSLAGDKTNKRALLTGSREIIGNHAPQAIIQGDYAISGDLAYISVRVVRISDNVILTSSDFTVRLNETLKEMADGETTGVSWPPQSVEPTETDATASKASAQQPEDQPTDAEPDKEEKEKRAVKLPNGPFATGEISLHPSNPLAARIIQTRLAELGFYKDRVDGVWKGHSRKALKEFKEAHGLKYALQWDINTQKALFAGTGQYPPSIWGPIEVNLIHLFILFDNAGLFHPLQ
jgi:hypothetical protein